MQKVSSGANKLLKLFFREQTIMIRAQKSKHNLFLDLVGLKNDFLMALHHGFADLYSSTLNNIWVKGLKLLALFCL